MKKKGFIDSLSERISYLNADEKNEILSYYSELIDDRMDMGENEEDIVSSLGSLDVIAENISGSYYHIPQSYGESTAAKPIAPTSASTGATTNSEAPVKADKSDTFKTIFSIVEIIVLIALAAVCIGVVITTVIALIVGVFVMIGSFVFMTHDFFAGLIQLGVAIIIIAVNSIISKLANMLSRFSIRRLKILISKTPA